MDTPFDIHYRGVAHSESLERLVRRKLDHLEHLFGHIITARVAVERAARRVGHDALFRVRVELHVPNEVIVAIRDPGQGTHAETLDAAVRDAFQRAKRQLLDYKQRVQRETKVPVGPAHGRVTQVFPYAGYGFLRTPDGRDLYFHENALIGIALRDLEPGTEVRYAESERESGPHASSVEPIGKGGHAYPPPP